MNKEKRERNPILEQIKTHKSVFVLYVILRLCVGCILIKEILEKDYQYVFLCVLVLLLFIVPNIIERTAMVRVPDLLQVIILLFIFAAEILGEVQEFYVHIPGWDTVLHTLNGFIAAAIGLSLVEILNNSKKIQFRLSPFFVVAVAFCFSMTVGVIWEFIEFGCDVFFHLDMQKDTVIHSISSVALAPDGGNTVWQIKNISSTVVNGQALNIEGYLDIGLYDTMKDLLVNFIGALIFSIAGYFYIKSGGKKNGVIKGLIPKLIDRKKNQESEGIKV